MHYDRNSLDVDPPSVKGRFEVPVLRYFEALHHAHSLATRGCARLQRLNMFHNTGDSRKDASEGTGRLAKGPVPFVTSLGAPMVASLESLATNPIYVLSFSEAAANTELLAGRFGLS